MDNETQASKLHIKITKGQLISERLFDVINFPKNQRKIQQISVPESNKWLNHGHLYIKALFYNVYYDSHMIIIWDI